MDRMDGSNNKFSSFVTPTGGGLFAYNAPESQYQQIAAQAVQQGPAQPGQAAGPQGQSQSSSNDPGAPGQSSPPAPHAGTGAGENTAASGITNISPRSPVPQPNPNAPAPHHDEQQPLGGVMGSSQAPPVHPPTPQTPQPLVADSQPQTPSSQQEQSPTNLSSAAQQAQPGAALPPSNSPQPAQQQPLQSQQGPSAYQQQMLQAKAKAPQMQQQTSLFETLLNDTYVSTPATMGFDTTLATTLGMNNNNLGDLRLEALNPNAQAAYNMAQAQQAQAAQGSAAAPQQYGGGLPPQAQPALPLLAQQNALLAQQNAALLASNPLLAAHHPYLAQHAMVPNVWNKWGGWNKWGYGHYPPPYKTPGAPIKMTDCDKGPEGCNLFVFHIPNDMTNLDLYQMFSAFGTVISARIMVDKVTGRSRGFGFVSYNNPESAELAIKNMNGFVVGHKRLKVEQKKDKHQLMPPTGTAPFSAAYLAPLQRWAHYHQQAQVQQQAHVQAQAFQHAAQAQASQGPPAGAPSVHAHAHAHAHHFYSPSATATAGPSGLFNQS